MPLETLGVPVILVQWYVSDRVLLVRVIPELIGVGCVRRLYGCDDWIITLSRISGLVHVGPVLETTRYKDICVCNGFLLPVWTPAQCDQCVLFRESCVC